MPRLHSPFVLDGGLNHEQIRSSPKPEAASLLRTAFTVCTRNPELPQGRILGTLHLTQLETFLADVTLQTASFIYAVAQESDMIPAMQRCLSALSSHGVKSQAASVFRLSPAQMLLSFAVNIVTIEGSSSITTLPENNPNTDDAYSNPDEQTPIGQFGVPKHGSWKRTSCRQMQVRNLAIVGFAAGKAIYAFPTFYVPEEAHVDEA
ncbi:hypothetical protein BJ170DRAFT_1932 [Xylariales sp. AK1849]|nr:hypothetical protein BJ170DRAFT_1932 [Xylariales sp. AK1849]